MLYNFFTHITFAYPAFLGLILLLPFWWWYVRKNVVKKSAAIHISSLSAPGLGSLRSEWRFLLPILRSVTVVCVIIILARPQERNTEDFAEGEGIDIVLCIDVSGSMTARDFKPNRLEAAKEVAINFVKERPTDRIGLVIFAGESFTLCPITTDHAILLSAITGIRNGLLEDGTAIGSGLSTGIDRLRGSATKTKIILLLTDGINNGGLIDPNTAKEIAKVYGIKVYTIGVGSEGLAPTPENTPEGVKIINEKVNIDERLLTDIATETGGKYFRAKDNQTLTDIYSVIDKLEKTKVEIIRSVQVKERFFPFALAAYFFLLLEMVLRLTVFRKFP
ncbi:MAG: VWA domain-containing protein [Ferruginibacter sp.]|nr:VWA domain-containing protein [Ferruginibacter sp.]